MGARPMVVTFRKQKRTCAWTALRPPRTRVPGTTMAAGADLPHDLNTFVIEQALGIERGFWGSVARGATFRSIGRKRTPQGKAVIASNIAALDAAEQQANTIYSAWRAGEESPVGAELDDMLRRWRALDEGDELVLEWAPARRPARR